MKNIDYGFLNQITLHKYLYNFSPNTKIDELLLIPCVILDFLCIHPFSDGNGRMSRLLTLLLLYKAGYLVGKYISIEMIIEKTKGTYYEALYNSSSFWHENKNGWSWKGKCLYKCRAY